VLVAHVHDGGRLAAVRFLAKEAMINLLNERGHSPDGALLAWAIFTGNTLAI